MANDRHIDFRAWETDFSTRQSVHPYTKYFPFRQALDTTADTLLTAERGEVAVNMIPNPRIEAADISMFVAAAGTTGAVVSRSTAQQSVGAASLLVNPENVSGTFVSNGGEGVYWESPTMPFDVNPQHLIAQVEHLEATDDDTSIKLEIRDAAGTTVLATSGTVALTSPAWTRSTVQYTIPGSTTPAAYRVYVTTAVAVHNTSFYLDKFMLEVREDGLIESTYVDGDLGVNYEWIGAANASESRKRGGISTIKGITIKNESGTSAEIVYVAFDITATATTGIPVLAGATFENTWPLGFKKKVSVVSASGTPTVSGVIWGSPL